MGDSNKFWRTSAIQRDRMLRKRRIKILGNAIEYRVDPNLPTRGHFDSKGITVRDWRDTYALLHEIGHQLTVGVSCCREHDEFMAHGFAIGLGALMGHDFTGDESDVHINKLVGYAERCPRRKERDGNG